LMALAVGVTGGPPSVSEFRLVDAGADRLRWLDWPPMVDIHRSRALSYAGLPEAKGSSAFLVRETSPLARPRLLDRVRDALRARHESRRTEESHVFWIRRYIFFTASGIRRKWATRKSRGSSPRSRWTARSPPRRRTRL
jgi:hypothetical protein